MPVAGCRSPVAGRRFLVSPCLQHVRDPARAVGVGDAALRERLRRYRNHLRDEVLDKSARLRGEQAN